MRAWMSATRSLGTMNRCRCSTEARSTLNTWSTSSCVCPTVKKIEDTCQEFLARHKCCQVLANQRILRLRCRIVGLDNQVFWRFNVLFFADLHDPLNELCQYLTKGRCAMRHNIVMRHREIDTKPWAIAHVITNRGRTYLSTDFGIRPP